MLFLCIKSFEISFSAVKLNKEIHLLCKSFYHNFRPPPPKALASGGFAHEGLCPLEPHFCFVPPYIIDPCAAPV